jgi:hypothetical protein
MVTDVERMEVVLDTPIIMMTDNKIASVDELNGVLAIAEEHKRPLLIIAEELAPPAVMGLLARRDKSNEARFCMAVAFEGDAKRGDRHAHILAYVPRPSKRRISQSMMIGLFPGEFRFLWNKIRPLSAPHFEEVWTPYPWEELSFGRANTARTIYTVKDVRQAEVSWSRFEFVTPPKFDKFINENLSVIRNRDRQRRAALALPDQVV